MVSEQTVYRLIEQAYASILEPPPWQSFLAALAHALDAQRPALIWQAPAVLTGEVVAHVGFEPGEARAYKEYFAAKNVLTINGRHLLTPGNVRSSEEMCERGLLVRSEYFNDYLRRLEVGYAAAATLLADGPRTLNLSLWKSERQGPFSPEDLRLLGTLTPHVARAAQLQMRLAGMQERGDALADGLERLPHGLLLLTGQGRVLHANRAARALLEQRDGLVEDRGELRAARSGDTQALRTSIAAATSLRVAAAAAPHESILRLSRPSGRPPLIACVTQAPAPVLGSEERVWLFVSDPEMPTELDLDMLRRLYGLTPAEARLAGVLATGCSTDIAAERLGITRQTLRTHLKRVLAKTGTHRQAEFVRVLLSGPAAVQRDSNSSRSAFTDSTTSRKRRS